MEHLLKVIHKRTEESTSLDEALKLKVSLGGLLMGARELGEQMTFEGLVNMANDNPRLTPIVDQLRKLTGLVKYMHNGIGKTPGGKFVFLKTGQEVHESDIIQDLDGASDAIHRLLSEINTAIPPKK